jgi:hypothetical protein
MLAVPAEKLLQLDLRGHGGWVPVVDGVDLTAPGAVLAAQGALAPVPVLAGGVSEDINPGGTNCAGEQCAEADFRQWGSKLFGFNASQVDLLVEAYGDEPLPAGGGFTKWHWAEVHAGADLWANCPARRMTRWATAAGQQAFWYRWEYAPLGPNGRYPKLAHHACEQPFVFHVLSETPEQAAESGGVYHIQESEVRALLEVRARSSS